MSSNNFWIGIEAEFLLRLHNTSKAPKDLEDFSAVLVNYFNETTIASGCPKMHSDIEGGFDRSHRTVRFDLGKLTVPNLSPTYLQGLNATDVE